jgi:hypothetical protein
MAISQTDKRQWLDLLRESRFVLDAMRHQTSQAVRPNAFTKSTQASMWQVHPGRLVRKYDAESSKRDARMTAALSDAVDEVRSFLNRPQPWRTTQVTEDLIRTVPAIDTALRSIELLKVDDETVSQVVDELERALHLRFRRNWAPPGDPRIFDGTGQLIAVAGDADQGCEPEEIALSRPGALLADGDHALEGWQEWATVIGDDIHRLISLDHIQRRINDAGLGLTER